MFQQFYSFLWCTDTGTHFHDPHGYNKISNDDNHEVPFAGFNGFGGRVSLENVDSKFVKSNIEQSIEHASNINTG